MVNIFISSWVPLCIHSYLITINSCLFTSRSLYINKGSVYIHNTKLFDEWWWVRGWNSLSCTPASYYAWKNSSKVVFWSCKTLHKKHVSLDEFDKWDRLPTKLLTIKQKHCFRHFRAKIHQALLSHFFLLASYVPVKD